MRDSSRPLDHARPLGWFVIRFCVTGLFILLGWFVWPTPYRTFILGDRVFRENRFTSSVEQLGRSGWVQLKKEATRAAELSDSELMLLIRASGGKEGLERIGKDMQLLTDNELERLLTILEGMEGREAETVRRKLQTRQEQQVQLPPANQVKERP